MDRFIFTMIAGILAGFALLKVPLDVPFLSSFQTIITTIAIFAIVVFSFVLIYKAVMALFSK
jgi:hypothetical protein